MSTPRTRLVARHSHPPYEELVRRLHAGPDANARAAIRALEDYLLDGVAIGHALPASLELPPSLSEAMDELWHLAWLQSGDLDAVAQAYERSDETRRRALVVRWGNVHRFLSDAAPLLPSLVAGLRSSDVDLAWTSCNVLGVWLVHRKLAPASAVPLLLEARSDARKGRAKEKVGVRAEHGLLLCAPSEVGDEVDAHLRPLLEAKTAADRKLASAYATRRALASKDAARLASLLTHTDRTVRTATLAMLSKGDVGIPLLCLARNLPAELQGRVADAVAVGAEPKHRASAEVVALRERLLQPGNESAPVEARRLSLENLDLRSCLPHLALLVARPDEASRAAAVEALDAVVALQGRTLVTYPVRALLVELLPGLSGAAREGVERIVARLSG